MKHTRVIVTHYGGPDALEVVEEECPEPKHGEVRVSVLVAGVGLPDIMARQGIHLSLSRPSWTSFPTATKPPNHSSGPTRLKNWNASSHSA